MGGDLESLWEWLAKWVIILAVAETVLNDWSSWADQHLLVTIPAGILLAAAGAMFGPAISRYLRRRPVHTLPQVTEQAKPTPVTAVTYPPEHLAAITATGFEEACCELLRRDGYKGTKRVGGPRDEGADVYSWTPDGRKIVVQCKQYTKPVGPEDVRAFNGCARPTHHADLPVMIALNGFTAQATAAAGEYAIHLLQRDTLVRWAAGEHLQALLPALSASRPTDLAVSQ